MKLTVRLDRFGGTDLRVDSNRGADADVHDIGFIPQWVVEAYDRVGHLAPSLTPVIAAFNVKRPVRRHDAGVLVDDRFILSGSESVLKRVRHGAPPWLLLLAGKDVRHQSDGDNAENLCLGRLELDQFKTDPFDKTEQNQTCGPDSERSQHSSSVIHGSVLLSGLNSAKADGASFNVTQKYRVSIGGQDII